MNIVTMKKGNFFPFFFLPVLLMGVGCVSTPYKKELIKKNEEIKTITLDLQHKEKTITDLLDRLSWKDQEIGKLTDTLRTSTYEIETLKSDIEKLRKTDLLDRVSMKDQQIGKLSDELRSSKTTIETLKSDIEKLRKTDILDRLAMKDKEIGKLSDKLHTATSVIETLKTDIGKLREVDMQMEETKEGVGSVINETTTVTPIEETTGTSTPTIKKQTTE